MASYDHLSSARNSPYGMAQSPYGSGDPYYNESSGYITTPPAKKGISKWVKIGIPVLILAIIGGVVGGIVATRNHNSTSASSSAASAAASAQKELGLFATATNSFYMVPIYPSTTNTAVFTTPTSNPASQGWPADPFQPSSPSPTNVRTDRPRLIAPAYKWDALPGLIANDPYLKYWNDTIFENATQYFNLPPVVYFMDGDSGILDNARQVKQRIKAYAYAYRMSNDTKWVDRTFLELQNAAGNTSNPFGPDNSTRWNPAHFLDTAEMSAAYGIAYDWLYDAWTPTQRSQIMSSLITYGLNNGVEAYGPDPLAYGWWKGALIEGNWNCVSNNGLTMAALAILGDDTTGTASQLLAQTVPNAKSVCAMAVSNDGTWSETANYWYFGTTAHAEMAASLISATGSDYGLLDSNPTFNLTGEFHMYVTGPTSMFNYGDTGPNKYSTTANSMIFYANQFQDSRFALFQRDRDDAAEPWTMFWYDPTISGAWWDGQPLDHFFDNSTDQWASMRSSWTDINALYIAMKAGTLQGHQTHNDLDCGTFVMDAMGTRWAGELGSGDYRSLDYFSNDTQISTRWVYYRKMSEGQNVILVNQANQNVLAAPTVNFGTTGEAQGSSTVYNVPSNSAGFFTADLTSAYFGVTSYKRGIRTINGRKQVLLQDEITASDGIMWRMHTNATVSINSGGTSATLTLDGQTMTMTLLSPPSGAQITTMAAQRFSTDPPTPACCPDQPNPGVMVVAISLPAGTYSLQVLFNPQWSGMSASDFVTPPFVEIDSWTTSSHP